jgi:glycosyltransferase involved in cell wall biosynthesis
MSELKISILLPVYNGASFLGESIESVLGQSLENFELIIWDDNSSDDSAAIIDSFRDSRIRRFSSNINLGLFKTLNLAIQQARAPWIRLWAQDDVMKSHCLETESKFLEKHPEVGMCYCGVDVIDRNGSITQPLPEDCTPDIVPPALAAQIMFYHGSIAGNIANVTLNKRVLEELGLFLEDMSIAGDFEMWVRISEDYSIGHINLPLIFLRCHAGQFSNRRKSYLLCMSEENGVYQTLLARQPLEEISYARSYDRRNRYLQYFHYMIRNLLLGDFELAIEAYKVIRRIDKPIKLLGLWLVTADQRLFRLPSKYTRESAERWQAIS